jgi:hypothetical protein
MKLNEIAINEVGTEFEDAQAIVKKMRINHPTELNAWLNDHPKSKSRNDEFLGRIIGPILTRAVQDGKIQDDGTKWPGIRKYRKLQPNAAVNTKDAVADLLVQMGVLKNRAEFDQILRDRAWAMHHEEYETMVEKLKKAKESMEEVRRSLTSVGH